MMGIELKALYMLDKCCINQVTYLGPKLVSPCWLHHLPPHNQYIRVPDFLRTLQILCQTCFSFCLLLISVLFLISRYSCVYEVASQCDLICTSLVTIEADDLPTCLMATFMSPVRKCIEVIYLKLGYLYCC